MLPLDKRKHLGFSALLAFGLYFVCIAIGRRRVGSNTQKQKFSALVSLVLTSVIGGAKEIFDLQQIGFPPLYDCPCRAEFADFVADLAGALLGIVIAVCLHKLCLYICFKSGREYGERGGDNSNSVEEQTNLQIDII
ncbi:hypothetical protein TrLO_g12776 [Triparma laevis f. longispina]|uniref:Uncharacterized protein n=1 Tax=Triparma laevis f. longispina TaxID=1714387 RepID=A0A9W7E3M1_9STRA|nr:hypothetical protein TrLO_g12776 [Triparma laevis f. longispina]